MSDFDTIGEFELVWDAINTGPAIKDGVIVQLSPLLVQLTGDIDENDAPQSVPATPYVAGLTVGSRVLCIEQHRRVMVFAVAP